MALSDADITLAEANFAAAALVVNGDETQTAIALPLGGTARSLRAALAALAEALVPSGVYAGGTTYGLGAAVSFNGASYVSMQALNTGHEPDTSPAWWMLLSAQGPAGASGVSAAALSLLASKTPAAQSFINLFNPAAVTAGHYISDADGSLVAYAIYSASDFIPANANGSMVCSVAIPGGTGIGFYDQNQAFVSSLAPIGAGVSFAVPANAAYVRLTVASDSINTVMVVNGTAVPGTFQPFGSILALAAFESGLSAVNATSSALLRTKTPVSTFANLFNAATITAGMYIYSDGTLSAYVPSSSSDYLPANANGEMVCSVTTQGGAYIAFYDSTLAFISSIAGPIAAGTAFAVPANASYLRFTVPNGSIATAMMVNGTVLPTGYVAFGAQPGATFAQFQMIQALISAMQPDLVNVFDPTKYLPGYQWSVSGGTLFNFGNELGLTLPIPVIAGATYTVVGGAITSGNTAVAGVFLDSGMNPILTSFMLADNSGSFQIVAPASACYLQQMLTTANIAGVMILKGTVVPPYFVPFAQPPVTTTSSSPWLGKKCAVWGDSITQFNIWQPAISKALGFTVTFQDALGGRPTGGSGATAGQGIFSAYGGDPVNGVNQGATVGSGTMVAANTYNNGTPGNTLAQDLAAAQPDFCIIVLGGNDEEDPTLGSMADSAVTASTYGFFKAALNGIHQALVTAGYGSARVILIEPYQFQDNSFVGAVGYTRRDFAPYVATCIEQVAATYGDRVIKTWSESGINAYTWAQALADTIHPTTYGWNNFIIPYWTKELAKLTPIH
jgi:hypothetical protein